MKFSEKTKQLLQKAGWYLRRNISVEELNLPYNDYPQNIIEFLQEYGNLKGECKKQDYTEVVNKFFLFPETDTDALEGDNYIPYYSNLLKKKLYPIGATDSGNGYDICCDVDGRVYLIGEYCSYMGKNPYEGIENILLSDWSKSLQLDEDTGKWWNRESKYVSLP